MAPIAGTAVVAIFAVMMAVLSCSGHRNNDSVSLGDLSPVEARDALGGRTAVLRKNIQAMAKQRMPYGLSPTAQKANRRLANYMSQGQNEVDALIAYVQFRTNPHRRISATCFPILRPQYPR